MVEFWKVRRSSLIHSPLTGFGLAEVAYEVRRDPLTGRTSRILGGEEIDRLPPDDFSAYIAASEPCFFCGRNLMEKTPRYPEEIIPGGRQVRGQSVLFPNLRAYADYAAVVVLSDRHYFGLPDLTPSLIRDALGNAREFALRVHAHDSRQRFLALNWNYLPPSGSSLVHTHIQAVIDELPMNAVREELAASGAYRRKQGSNYWIDLCREEEMAGERYLGAVGRCRWLAAFAPVGFHQIEGVVPGASLPADLTDDLLTEISLGLLRGLAYYHSAGLSSFNFTLSTAPLDGEGGEDTAVHLTLLARPRMRPFYRNDSSAYERLYRDGITDLYPEEIARRARPFFQTPEPEKNPGD